MHLFHSHSLKTVFAQLVKDGSLMGQKAALAVPIAVPREVSVTTMKASGKETSAKVNPAKNKVVVVQPEILHGKVVIQGANAPLYDLLNPMDWVDAAFKADSRQAPMTTPMQVMMGIRQLLAENPGLERYELQVFGPCDSLNKGYARRMPEKYSSFGIWVEEWQMLMVCGPRHKVYQTVPDTAGKTELYANDQFCVDYRLEGLPSISGEDMEQYVRIIPVELLDGVAIEVPEGVNFEEFAKQRFVVG